MVYPYKSMHFFSLYPDALRAKRNHPNKLDVNNSGATGMQGKV